MSDHRRPEIPFTDAPRGTCRWCGEGILHQDGEKQGEPNLRRRWHPACVEVYNATDPREARRLVRKRDRGRCADCGLDTYALRRKIRAVGRGATRELRRLGYKPRKSLWELDHIVPLIDGGGHDSDNLQTLCTPCHVKKTAEEARLRAAHARESAALEAAALEAQAAEPNAIEQAGGGAVEPAAVGAGEPERAEDASASKDHASGALRDGAGRAEQGQGHAAGLRPARAPRKKAGRSLDELLEQADAANARAEALLARF